MPLMFAKLKERHQQRMGEVKKVVSLDAVKNLKIAYIPYNELLKEGIVAGFGWAFGATIGFVVVSTLMVFVLKQLGGLPLVGSWIASVVQVTQEQLLKRTPIFPQ